MRRGTLTSCSVTLAGRDESTVSLEESFGDSADLVANFFITELLAKLKMQVPHCQPGQGCLLYACYRRGKYISNKFNFVNQTSEHLCKKMIISG